MNEIREYYKANGICIDCGQREAAPGRLRCMDCLGKAAEYENLHRKPLTTEQKKIKTRRQAQRREQRRTDGKCIYCGNPLMPKSNYCCIDCWVKYRRRYNREKMEHSV